MNLEIDIKRFNNEDVISTSEFCSNHAAHIYIISNEIGSNDDEYRLYVYDEEDNKWYFNEMTAGLPNNLQENTYYLTDGRAASEDICNNVHNPSDAIKVAN